MKYIIKIIIASIVIFSSIILSIICFPSGTFHQSMDSLLQDKYRRLMETNEPKIIIVAGSSSAFGLDQQMLKDATGYEVVNLGLHAGLGYLFITELAKQNINEGDIVLLAYEYGWEKDDGFTRIGTDHIMAGIDDDLSMYTTLLFDMPTEIWKNCVGYILCYAKQKNTYVPYDGVYSRSSFDPETAQMIVIRNENIDLDSQIYDIVDLNNIYISDYSKEYLIRFKEYVEQNGAKIFFIAPPLFEEAASYYDSMEYDFKRAVEQETGIEYISDPKQYLFPHEWMYDTIYHCNSIGEKKRTELLIEDLKRAGLCE